MTRTPIIRDMAHDNGWQNAYGKIYEKDSRQAHPRAIRAVGTDRVGRPWNRFAANQFVIDLAIEAFDRRKWSELRPKSGSPGLSCSSLGQSRALIAAGCQNDI